MKVSVFFVIVDTFMFNKDFAALEIRLAELYSVVDLFVICESRYTHSGKRKKLYLTENLDLYSKYADKIKIIIDNRRHFTRNARIREMQQRNCISKFLSKIPILDGDFVIHSDCDEIPRASTLISELNSNNCNLLFELDNYVNYLNLYAGKWRRIRVVSGNNFKSVVRMKQDIFLFSDFEKRRHKFPFIRVPVFWTHRKFFLWKIPQFIQEKPNLKLVENGGWHFNNLFDAEEIISKIESSSHTEMNTEEIKSAAIDRFKQGREIYTGEKYKMVEIDDSFPTIVYKNISKWSKFIFTQKND
jgi:beta-1,4-mannosyl-glycoprotein beta-1,4-N-acetylglucosaminyltransferase